nr:reverse transcriptase domain-containing protein [Tanacetum cinerariifolium]
MRTRNSYFPNNSSVTILRRQNKRRTLNVIEPELRTIVEVTPMTDNHTMEELLQAPMEGDVPDDVIKLMMFPYSLEGSARVWYDKEPPNSILTWEDLVNKFMNQFFLPRKPPTSKMKSLVLLKDSRRHLERHGNDLRKFLEHSLNAATGGNLLSKTTREALQIIENKSKVRYSRNKPNVSRMNTNSRENASKTDDRIDKLADKISTLVDIFAKKVVAPALVKAVEESCVTCGGPHAHYNCDATNSNQPSVCWRKTLPKPNIPYPSRLNDQKLRKKATNQIEKFFQIFQGLNFDISFVDSLLLMQKFASTIKSLLTNKDKLFELAKIPLNENCSAMLLKNLPEKLGDPGKFLITCDFSRMDVCHALANLDASLNLMPLSIWKNLSLSELTPTRMNLELADRSITRPKGVAKDVFVNVGKFHFLTDFVVVDFEADPRCMCTRNSYFPNNSSVTIPRRQNKRRTPNVVEPGLRTIVEVAPMADNLTMKEPLQAPTEGDVPNDVIKLMMFPYSLEGSARVCSNNPVQQGFSNKFSSYKKDNDQMMRNMQSQINSLKGEFKNEIQNTMKTHQTVLMEQRNAFQDNLQNMLSGFFQNQSSTSGTLLSNTIPNPKGEMKEITTCSGVAYEGPLIPTTPKKVVERETEETTDKEQTNFQGSTAHIQPPVTLILEPNVSKTLPKPNIPYPSRLNDQKLREKATNQMEKFFQIFQDLHFDITKIPLNENCSAMLLEKLLEKLGDPKKFLIPCDFLRMDVCHALADLGASINLMPLSICKKLSLPELTPTWMTQELADRSTSRPKGLVEDIFVKVGKFHFLIDFVVVDFEADPRVPLILGRTFLRTDRALIHVYGEEITLWVKEEAVTFNLNQTTRYSSTYDDLSVNQIDIIDVAREEYAQETLGFSNNTLGGNPTSIYEPIIFDSSPPLTPFEGSDFILEGIEAYLKDESISPEIDHADCDPEEDIYLIEKLLNDDPFQLPLMDLKQGEVVKGKSSTEEPPELELKDLPSHLEYAYLEGIVLGHKISKNGLEVDRAKVDVIAKLPHPTTVKGVRSYLRHAGFYQRFIQDFSKITRPMTYLLEKETPFVFSKDCIDAFETLKKNLTEATILVIPDWKLPFELMCDASEFAIGAVLGQQKTKHFQPIHYASKTMTKAQIHYTMMEIEMLAVVYDFENFRPYRVLYKIIMYTDHSALKYHLNNAQSTVTYTSISFDSDGPSWGIPLNNAGEFPEMDPYEEIAKQEKVHPLSPTYVEDDDEDPEEDLEEYPSEEHEPKDNNDDPEEDPNEEHEPEDSDETEPLEEDETAVTPPPPRHHGARIYVRPQTPMTASTYALIDAFAAGSSPFPLPPTSLAYDQA